MDHCSCSFRLQAEAATSARRPGAPTARAGRERGVSLDPCAASSAADYADHSAADHADCAGLVRVVMLAVVIPVICQRAGTVVCAQEQVTLRSDLLLYGDNTEFRNPFREGDTLFGAAVRVAFDVELNAKASVLLGAFGKPALRIGQSVRAGAAGDCLDGARPPIVVCVRHASGPGAVRTGWPVPSERRRGEGSRSRWTARTPAAASARDAGVRSSVRSRPAVRTSTARALRHATVAQWPPSPNTAAHRERFDGG